MAPTNGHAAVPNGPNDALVITRGGRTIYLPPLARLLLTESQRRERARLMAGRYFMVNMRLGDVGEIFRCGRCNGKHARLTKYCLDRPFSGLHGALYGFVQTVKEADAIGLLAPTVARRLESIRRLFSVNGIADLSTSHPGLARSLAGGDDPSGSGDLDVGVISLGLIERIEPRDAQRQLDRINTRAAAYRLPSLLVPGLRGPAA
jgi:hypothetical protein